MLDVVEDTSVLEDDVEWSLLLDNDVCASVVTFDFDDEFVVSESFVVLVEDSTVVSSMVLPLSVRRRQNIKCNIYFCNGITVNT